MKKSSCIQTLFGTRRLRRDQIGEVSFQDQFVNLGLFYSMAAGPEYLVLVPKDPSISPLYLLTEFTPDQALRNWLFAIEGLRMDEKSRKWLETGHA